MKGRDILDDLDEKAGNEESLQTSEVLSTLHDVCLYKDVSQDIDDHKDLIKLLRKARPEDVINLRLSCPGGSVQTGYLIINAIKQCKGFVHCEIEAPCYSMASVIALACDSLRLNIGTFLMFHNYSGGFWGKGSEMKDHIHNYAKINRDMDLNYCAPFLTKKEIDGKLGKDIDIYIHWDDKDLPDRIKRHFK